MKVLNKVALSSALVVGSLGLVAVATGAPAGAAAKAVAKTYSGAIKTVDAKKDTFTIKSGAATYVVDYTAATKWTKGTAASLKAGATVSVSGTLVKTVIHASAISA